MLFEKPQTSHTKAKEPARQHTPLQPQSNTWFNATATVANGKITRSSKGPKDITNQKARGKISYYAEDAIKAAINDYRVKNGKEAIKFEESVVH